MVIVSFWWPDLALPTDGAAAADDDEEGNFARPCRINRSFWLAVQDNHKTLRLTIPVVVVDVDTDTDASLAMRYKRNLPLVSKVS